MGYVKEKAVFSGQLKEISSINREIRLFHLLFYVLNRLVIDAHHEMSFGRLKLGKIQLSSFFRKKYPQWGDKNGEKEEQDRYGDRCSPQG